MNFLIFLIFGFGGAQRRTMLNLWTKEEDIYYNNDFNELPPFPFSFVTLSFSVC